MKPGSSAGESEKRIKVLYVCPLAHWAGHPPQTLINETSALYKAGVEVTLCTFGDVLDPYKLLTIPHASVVSSWIGFPLRILKSFEHFTRTTRGLAWFLEHLATLCLAVRLRKSLRYDVIYLRDGDPFIFTPFVLGLVFKDYRWAINLVGIGPVRSPGSLFFKFINASFWKPIYRRSLSRNRFTFLCENSYMKEHFEIRLLDGILSGKVNIVPGGAEKATEHILQSEARRYLGLPEDMTIFLHFGAVHPGKDMETVFAAIREIPDALLVHAGKTVPGIDLIHLVKYYGLQNRAIIRDEYIPEVEKKYYFTAADAMILSYKEDFWQTASMLWQAAKFGLPVVATDIGELGELTKRYGAGLVFKAEDATSLTGAISDFMSSTRMEREAMARNCDKLCDDFSLDSWSRKCTSLLAELCGDGEDC